MLQLEGSADNENCGRRRGIGPRQRAVLMAVVAVGALPCRLAIWLTRRTVSRPRKSEYHRQERRRRGKERGREVGSGNQGRGWAEAGETYLSPEARV